MTRSARAYQLGCVLAALAVLLAVAAPVQQRLQAERSSAMPAGALPEAQDLNSFALGLLLGGFRGPLVMYLWVTSEEAKNNEDTTAFLTQVDLIGDLQPQFATIYTHQSWNLAYNVSVQYNRDAEKYYWVMQGIRFAEKGERRLPHNTDVLIQLGGNLYFDKLGNSTEAPYFCAQFRADSLASHQPLDDKLDPRNPKLDANGYLLDAYKNRWAYIDRLDAILKIIDRNNANGVKSPMPDRPPPGVRDLCRARAERADRPPSLALWPERLRRRLRLPQAGDADWAARPVRPIGGEQPAGHRLPHVGQGGA